MRKLLRAGICMTAALVVLTGCGKSTETKETTAAETTVAGTRSQKELTDEAKITLGNYKGLDLTRVKAVVSDDEVEAELSYIANQYPEVITGRPAQLGDIANIDYKGTKDGVAFEGGTAAGYDLELGGGGFIDGFEDGVVGMEIGEEKDLNLTFPDPYLNNPDLAGKAVVFHVKLNSLKTGQNVEIDDALAKRATGSDDATLETLKSQVYEDLLSQKERTAFYDAGNQALDLIIENSEITCDPDAVDQMYEQLQSTYTMYAQQYGMDLDSFLQAFLQTDLEGLKVNAENLVKQEMVLNEIIAAEKLEATTEQKDALAKANGFENAMAMAIQYGQESVNRLFEMEAAYAFLLDNSNVTEVEAETETAAVEPVTYETETAAETETVDTETETAAAETKTADTATETTQAK